MRVSRCGLRGWALWHGLLLLQLGKEATPSMVTFDLSQSIHNDRVMPPVREPRVRLPSFQT